MKKLTRSAAVGTVAAAALCLPLALPASAASGDYDIYLRSVDGGAADDVQYQGVGNLNDGDVPLFCDVDSGADGEDTDDGDVPVLFNSGEWLLVDYAGARTVAFGRSTDLPLCGNWSTDNDTDSSTDEIAVRRGNRYFLAGDNVNGGGGVTSFAFGRSTDQSLVGDWDGDGDDEIGLRRGSTFFFASDNVDGGGAVSVSQFGRASDIAVAGSFAGEDFDTVALHRGNAFYVSDDQPGTRVMSAAAFTYGRSSDLPVAGAPFDDEIGRIGVLRIER